MSEINTCSCHPVDVPAPLKWPPASGTAVAESWCYMLYLLEWQPMTTHLNFLFYRVQLWPIYRKWKSFKVNKIYSLIGRRSCINCTPILPRHELGWYESICWLIPMTIILNQWKLTDSISRLLLIERIIKMLTLYGWQSTSQHAGVLEFQVLANFSCKTSWCRIFSLICNL